MDLNNKQMTKKTLNLMDWQIEAMRMMTDRQISDMGYCPLTVTQVWMALDRSKGGRKGTEDENPKRFG